MTPALGARPADPPGSALAARPRTAWHVRTGAVVLAWLVADVVVAILVGLGVEIRGPRWLLIHLLALGAVSNAILIWSWHFTAAVLRLPSDSRREQAWRLVALNLGAVVTVVGLLVRHRPLMALGAFVVVAVAVWHAGALVRRIRGSLPARFGLTVHYYVAAGLALVVGAGVAAAMVQVDASAEMRARLVLAHAIANVFGWVGLTVIGTLMTLWPTMLRTRIAEGTTTWVSYALPMLGAGLVAGAGGALAGWRWLVVLGLLAYLAGVIIGSWPHVRETRQRGPASYATWSVLAAVCWLAVLTAALAVGAALAEGWPRVTDLAGRLSGLLLAGFVAQVLLGALSYLVPMALGGGHLTRATTKELDRAGVFRAVLGNSALVVLAVGVGLPHAVRVAVAGVLVVVAAAVPVLAVRAWLVARRDVPEPGRVSPIPAPGHTAPRRLEPVLALALLAVVMVIAALVAT